MGTKFTPGGQVHSWGQTGVAKNRALVSLFYRPVCFKPLNCAPPPEKNLAHKKRKIVGGQPGHHFQQSAIKLILVFN
jgi:hypothetical protein